jgi:radical SAM family uncharacterized protein
MNNEITNILKSVSKPGRYCGGEHGQIIKDKEKVSARWAFCFPDTYEIGMSNLGMRILYGALNNQENIWCERVFAPWTDMEEKMKEHNIPLYALESKDPVKDFDIVGFTLQYEMCYTNVLNMLSLAQLPLLAKDRTDDMPIIIGGGPCTYNAEPIADFFDCFSIGEGEEMLVEFTELYIKMKKSGNYSKKAFLHEAARSIKGTYVPSFYDVTYNDDGTINQYKPIFDDIPQKVEKRIIAKLDDAYFPKNPVIPYIETVHDRIMLEVFRGCIRGCRFCQAGIIYRPVREKSPNVLCEQAKDIFQATGYDEISLSSLSISDYSCLEDLTNLLLDWTEENMVSISLPSLRIDSFSEKLMQKVASVRASSLTFAPEAGTQRLRDVINKNVTYEDLMRSVGIAFNAGKSLVKLYFMEGLPTEVLEDLDGISALASAVIDEYYKTPNRNKAKKPSVTVSVSCFVPKPFTPFQWEPQDTIEMLEEKQKYLGSKITDRKIKYNHHDAKVSRVEAVLARGNRKISTALIKAHKMGMSFDAWDEYFDYNKWVTAFESAGLDMSFYANREYSEDEILPWDVIDCGVSKEFLLKERHRAYSERTTEHCRNTCSGCGANKLGGEKSCCPKPKI